MAQRDDSKSIAYKISMPITLIDDTPEYAVLVYCDIARKIINERARLLKQHPSATLSDRGSVELHVDYATAAKANIGALLSSIRQSLTSVGIQVYITAVHDIGPDTLRVIYRTQIHITDTAPLSLGDLAW